MFGYQRIKLIINQLGDLKIVNMPPINDFKIILVGDSPSNSDVNIVLETEAKTEAEIIKNLEQRHKNLKLYLNLYSENVIDVIIHDYPKFFSDKNEFEKIILHSLEKITDVKLPHYLNDRTTQQHILLQTALDELKNGDMFNAFPKLVNWLDDNDGKGSSRFCSIRDSCDHGILDKQRAIKNVNNDFPNEFEFEDDTLKRNSEKNIESMKKHMPEVLNHIKKVFKTKYVTC